MSALLKEVQRLLKETPLPGEYNLKGSTENDVSGGYIFIKEGEIIKLCVVDPKMHASRNKAYVYQGITLVLEKYADNWEFVCAAETPQQLVGALFTYILTGVFDDL